MKRVVSVLIMVLVLTFIVPSIAATISSGWQTTSGGILGKCRVQATLNYQNSTAAGSDYAQAITEASAVGTMTAKAVIWYTDGNGNSTNSSTATVDGTRASTGYAYNDTQNEIMCFDGIKEEKKWKATREIY